MQATNDLADKLSKDYNQIVTLNKSTNCKNNSYANLPAQSAQPPKAVDDLRKEYLASKYVDQTYAAYKKMVAAGVSADVEGESPLKVLFTSAHYMSHDDFAKLYSQNIFKSPRRLIISEIAMPSMLYKLNQRIFLKTKGPLLHLRELTRPRGEIPLILNFISTQRQNLSPEQNNKELSDFNTCLAMEKSQLPDQMAKIQTDMKTAVVSVSDDVQSQAEKKSDLGIIDGIPAEMGNLAFCIDGSLCNNGALLVKDLNSSAYDLSQKA